MATLTINLPTEGGAFLRHLGKQIMHASLDIPDRTPSGGTLVLTIDNNPSSGTVSVQVTSGPYSTRKEHS